MITTNPDTSSNTFTVSDAVKDTSGNENKGAEINATVSLEETEHGFGNNDADLIIYDLATQQPQHQKLVYGNYLFLICLFFI